MKINLNTSLLSSTLKPAKTLAFLICCLAGVSAQAATLSFTELDDAADGSVDGVIVFAADDGKTYKTEYQPFGTDLVQHVYLGTGFQNQSPQTIQDGLEESTANGGLSLDLGFVGEISELDNDGYITFDGAAFDVVTVHFGAGKDYVQPILVFILNSSVTLFDVDTWKSNDGGSTWSDNNSNARGYSSNVSVVPIPAAAWLFASALAGMAFVRRRQPADGKGQLAHTAPA